MGAGISVKRQLLADWKETKMSEQEKQRFEQRQEQALAYAKAKVEADRIAALEACLDLWRASGVLTARPQQ
mgnify:CR=1 FL=1